MAKLIFRTNDAPEDEIEAIRMILSEHQIDFYETSSGNWGFSVAGIWIKNNQDKPQARELIDEYQARLHLNSPIEAEPFLRFFFRQPLRVIVFISIILFVVYFSLMPFLSMGK